jgi:thiosulfate reductase cytochrome b subunit
LRLTDGVPTAVSRSHWIYRYAGLVRVAHWTNALCLAILMMSGLQIFNAHPALYWGEDSHSFRFARQSAAADYNNLQRVSYVAVILILAPLAVFTGLTMSPAVDAAAPWLLDVFDRFDRIGRGNGGTWEDEAANGMQGSERVPLASRPGAF